MEAQDESRWRERLKWGEKIFLKTFSKYCVGRFHSKIHGFLSPPVSEIVRLEHVIKRGIRHPAFLGSALQFEENLSSV